ncbi:MAG: S1/P1 nuclease [Steroidobacteraceae bacterium]
MWQAAGMTPADRSLLHLLLLLVALWGQNAAAWGNTGHRITGYVAESLLTPATRRQVRQLLGEESLAAAATYMDVQRMMLSERWPETERWHYDNQPVCYRQQAYCLDGNCATRQIERFRQLLADRHADKNERALALRLMIHMLGDIHQPLHMTDNHDRGGNNLYVRLYAGGERYRLHEVMDTVLLRQLIGKQRIRNYASDLRQRYHPQLHEWQQGSLNDWAQQTHQLAVTESYGGLPGFACNIEQNKTITLPQSYVQDARQYLPQQLARAGVRIAAVLNATLGSE